LHTAEAVLSQTTKLTNFAPQNAAEAHVLQEMVEIATEGRHTSRQPAWKGVVSTISPLRMDKDSGEVLRFFAQNGIPVVIASCPMCGSTSPFSLIGTMVLQTAENLAMIAMAQAAREGTRLVMGGAAGSMDMRTGSVAYGTPERSLMMGANNQIQRFYGLPTHGASIAVNGWESDVQTGLERELIIFTRMLFRPNFWGGAGAMCSGKAVSHVQALIDNHALEMTDRFMCGIDTSDELWAVDSIQNVGPGGNFMTDPLTIDLLRSGEMWYSKLTNMEEDRGQPMVVRALEEVERMLEVVQTPVPERVRVELERYVEKAADRPQAGLS
jgi:trimethylamine--corrinoid protein Co-methyltransferase